MVNFVIIIYLSIYLLIVQYVNLFLVLIWYPKRVQIRSQVIIGAVFYQSCSKQGDI